MHVSSSDSLEYCTFFLQLRFLINTGFSKVFIFFFTVAAEQFTYCCMVRAHRITEGILPIISEKEKKSSISQKAKAIEVKAITVSPSMNTIGRIIFSCNSAAPAIWMKIHCYVREWFSHYYLVHIYSSF